MDDALDPGPFFHGTRAALQVGDLLTPGFRSNYRPEIVMNHVYFTALLGGGMAAEIIPGDGPPRVYEVEPLGPFENDPNVTDKSSRQSDPVVPHHGIPPDRRGARRLDASDAGALALWRERLAKMRDENAEIIN